MKNFTIFFSVLLGFSTFADVSWPQWRGPNRDGIAKERQDEIILLKKPLLLWDSQYIPSQDNGGFGSIITDSKNAYLSLVWHREIPTETRMISDLVLRELGARKINLPNDLIRKAEQDRLMLRPRLRGSKLEEWIKVWLDKNLSQRQKMIQGDNLASRFRKGKLALPVDLINQLHQEKNRVFANQAEIDEWLGKQQFTIQEAERISQAVPPTKRVADDVVLALDLHSGKTLWKRSLSGSPSGRTSSSTPTYHKGKLFIVGSSRIFCVDSKTGGVVWDNKIEIEGVASSPLCVEGLVVVLAGNLRAYSQETGELVWENKEVKGKSASPIEWNFDGLRRIICNGSKKVFAISPTSGKTLWSGPGGGSSTPVCNRNLLIVHSNNESAGLIAYEGKENYISELWRYPKITRRADSSPLVYEGVAYLIGAGMRASFDLTTGELFRKEVAKHDISSPVIFGNKIFAYEIKGSFLQAIDTTPGNFRSYYRYKLNALRCTSPCITNGKLLIRKDDRISCYQLCE